MSAERRPQIYTDPNNASHYGETIELPNGITGYVEWNEGSYSNNQRLKTARMKMSGRIFEIEVVRRKKGTEQKLITELICILKEKQYQRLIILGAMQSVKAFYDKVFDRLIEQGLIESYSVQAREWHNVGCTDYYYDVILRLD